MTKTFLYKIILIGLFSGIVSCIRFTETKFDAENLFHAVADNVVSPIALSKSIPAKEYNKGVVADFNNGIKGNWWGSDKIRLFGRKDALVVQASAVGISYDRFGHRFSTFCDFTENNVLKIRARAEGNSIPVLRIDLKDAYGYSTNHVDTKTRILICEGYVDYFFKYEGKFEQGWPSRAQLDKKRISELEFFINPGGPAYTGTIYIDDITVLNAKNLEETITNSCAVDLQSNTKADMKYWWVNSNKYFVKYIDEKSGVEIISMGTGSRYESFGRGFSATDLNENPVIRVRAKTVGKISPDFRVDLVDSEGNSTNGSSIVKSISADNTFRDYFFDFKDKLYQGWPQTKTVNGKKITELMFFVNPGGKDFYGKIYISEIEIINDFKRNYDKDNSSENTNQDTQLLTQRNLPNWWVSEGAKITIDDKNLVVSPSTNSAKEITMGAGFDTKDLSSLKQLKLVIKSSPKNFRIKLFDEKSNTTDFITSYKVENLASGFSEYYFDLSESLQKINFYKISGISIYYTNEITEASSNDVVVVSEVVLLNNVNK